MSDMSVIRQALADQGYEVRRHGERAKHERVYRADGTPLQDDGVPVTIPSTPGDWRARKNMVAQLRRLGALDHDPFSPAKPTRKKRRVGGVKLPPAPPPIEELPRRELHDRLTREIESFMAIRAGGWSNTTRVAAGAVAWMGAQDMPGRPLSLEYAEQQLTKLCGGMMLPLAEEQAWQRFLDEINGDDDPLLRWIEIDRMGRGI